VSLAADDARDNRFGRKLTSYGLEQRAAERVTALREVTMKYFSTAGFCGRSALAPKSVFAYK
jgi:hypothetical protein